MNPLRTLIVGFLAFSAIATSADAQQEAAKRRVPAEILKQFDANQDGALDKQERRAAHEAIQKRRDLRGDLAKQTPQQNRSGRAQAAPEGNPAPQTRRGLRAHRGEQVEATPNARQQAPSRRSLKANSDGTGNSFSPQTRRSVRPNGPAETNRAPLCRSLFAGPKAPRHWVSSIVSERVGSADPWRLFSNIAKCCSIHAMAMLACWDF